LQLLGRHGKLEEAVCQRSEGDAGKGEKADMSKKLPHLNGIQLLPNFELSSSGSFGFQAAVGSKGKTLRKQHYINHY
jgi:hypothetical protein